MPESLPPPPSLPGVTWRPAAKSDAVAIVALQDACFEVDDGFREVESEILVRWESDYCSVDEDTLIAIGPHGDVVAAAWSYLPTIAATKWRAFADTHVHPSHRTPELNEFVHDWWEARSRQRLAVKDDGMEQWLWRDAYDWQTDKIEFLEAHGYSPERYFDELSRDLSGGIATKPLADGLAVQTWDTAPLGDSLAVHNASFADHWGSQPISEKSWANNVNEFLLPAASYVVYEDDAPVSYLLSAAFPHDFEDKGRTEAWVEGLGTLRSHRKRGIASALVTFAMEEFNKTGMQFAVLGVDSENPTGAHHIYENLGFVHDRRSIALIKVVK